MSPVINPVPFAVPNPLPSALEEPCAWPLNTNCCPDWDTYDPSLQEDATSWATNILWALTGRRFGECTIITRPCGGNCRFSGGWMTFPVWMDGGNAAAAGGWFPFVDAAGQWRNCGCIGGCRCAARCEVWLPGPVTSVSEVVVDGVTIDPSAYRIDNNNILVRQDGECWPRCQDFDLSGVGPDADDSTFFVTYQRGNPVPAAGQIAAGLLACEFAKMCTTGCKLPGNLSSLSRQGVEISIADPTDILNAGLTGISQVDTWIRAVNPNKLTSRPRVYSTDVNYPREVTAP